MNVLHLWFLLALALPLAWTADTGCQCTFPSQMAGAVSLIKIRLRVKSVLFEYFNFELDLQRQLAKLMPTRNYDIIYYLDYNSMNMYTFDNSSKSCTSATMPDWMKMPACVPSGITYLPKTDAFGNKTDLFDTYTNNDEDPGLVFPLYKYSKYEVKRNTNPCQPTRYIDIRSTSWIVERTFLARVLRYELDDPESLRLPQSSIDQCTPGRFPWNQW